MAQIVQRNASSSPDMLFARDTSFHRNKHKVAGMKQKAQARERRWMFYKKVTPTTHRSNKDFIPGKLRQGAFHVFVRTMFPS
jgi:hypothetical protein